jgi:putative membrane protein
MKIIATGVMLGVLTAVTGCQTMNNMGDRMGMHGMKADLNDAQIISVLHTANMGEITQGQIALQKAQRTQVKSFAQKMVTEHTQNDQKGKAIAANAGMTPQSNPISMKLQKDSDEIVMKLNKADAKDFDKTYINSQVKVHKMVLETIDKKLLPNAKNSDLRNHLMMTRAAVAMHLQLAEQLENAM